jgi:hypothetical protein
VNHPILHLFSGRGNDFDRSPPNLLEGVADRPQRSDAIKKAPNIQARCRFDSLALRAKAQTQTTRSSDADRSAAIKAALSAMTVKTDRNDARGLAQLMRLGWFRPVHAKSMGSQEVRALLVAQRRAIS